MNYFCKIIGCGEEKERLDFCHRHYEQYEYGTIDVNGFKNKRKKLITKKTIKYCKIKGCSKISIAKGFCKKHYFQDKKGIIDAAGNKIKKLKEK